MDSAEIIIPKINNNDVDVQMISWIVDEFSYVEKDEPVAEVETSKMTVSIQAKTNGYLRYASQPGDIVAIGSPIGQIFSSEETARSAKASAGKTASSKADTTDSKDLKKPVAEITPDQKTGTFDFTRFSDEARVYIEKANIDPSTYAGQGLITIHDVDPRQKRKAARRSGSMQALPSLHTTSTQLDAPRAEIRTNKIPRSKAIEIEHLQAGQSGLVNSSLTVNLKSAGVRRAIRAFPHLNNQVLPIIVYELGRLLKKYSRLNGFYAQGQINEYADVNIGIAIDLDKGLKVPVLKRSDTIDLAQTSAEINRFAKGYITNNFSDDDFTDGTITVTDLSNDNIMHFQPLINSHQSAILGIGGDGESEGHPMSFTLVFDHRVSSGREVASFLNELKERFLSYDIEKSPNLSVAVRSKEINCHKCLISLGEYYDQCGSDASMLRTVDANGNPAYVCHICQMGF